MDDLKKSKVLIVDDELEILKALNRGLHTEPYEKFFASSGMQALDFFLAGEEISVVVTDMRMPGMTGLDLLTEIHAISPETVKIVLTGYTQLPQILATVNKVDIYKFLTKPWDLENELKVFIQEGIELYQSRRKMGATLKSTEQKTRIFNKMLMDSYKKADYMTRYYEELIKVVNHHHLLTANALKRVDLMSPESLKETVDDMNDRMYFINKIFDFGRHAVKSFTMEDVKKELNMQPLEKDIEILVKEGTESVVYEDNFKVITNLFNDLIERIGHSDSKIVQIALTHENGGEQASVRLVIKTQKTEALKKDLLTRGRFFQRIIDAIGGRATLNEVEDSYLVALTLPVTVKRSAEEGQPIMA